MFLLSLYSADTELLRLSHRHWILYLNQCQSDFYDLLIDNVTLSSVSARVGPVCTSASLTFMTC